MTLFRSTWRALSHILLALAMVLAAVHVFRLLLLPTLQSLFSLGPEASSLIRRSGILLCALGGYGLYVRNVEKRAVTELHLAPRNIVLGAASGSIAILVVILALFLVGAYQLIEFRGFNSALLGTACVIVIAAMLEEIVFRGILFRLCEQAWGMVPALWLQALLFSAVHYANIEAGASTLAVVTTMIAGTLIGVMWAQIYVLSRNLWVCCANHAAWNFTVILSGAPLSGIEDWMKLAPISIRVQGPDWLHGGAFGPEDSIFALALTALVLVLLHRWIKRPLPQP